MRAGIVIFSLVTLCLWCGSSYAQHDPETDPNQIFYTANHYYHQQDYAKAVAEYQKLLDMGMAGGNLYYNIGNGFMKLGRVGYALVYYEKAKRLMPHDGDLKSNLAYARSLVDSASQEEPQANVVMRTFLEIYGDLSLASISGIALAIYLILLAASAFSIVNPMIGRKFAFITFLIGVCFIVNAAAFTLRYYGEVIVRHGAIVQKNVECKYEPIDKSTTYYTLHEGNGVVILKTKEGWRQIRRSDGKIGWIPKSAAEEV